MAEYITKEQAKSAIKKRLGTMDLFESRFNEDVDAISTADVVEVTRCRDCKHFYYDTGKEPSCAFVCGLPRPREHDFCSYGERGYT